jgi:heptosyltransferase I
VWVTHPRWEPLVESSGLASAIWTLDTRSLSSLRTTIGCIRRSSWDAAIDYQGLWKSAALPFLGGVKKRIGFSSAAVREYGVPVLYTDHVRARTAHVADQNGELSLHAGARTAVGCAKLRVPLKDEFEMRSWLRSHGIDRYVVLSPGGGWRSKCWPPDRFGELCREIRKSLGLRCIVNYGPGEDDLAAAVSAASGEAAPLLWNDGLGSLMAILRESMCIVGGDTGPLHLGVALGTPAVALFGPTDPARNGPYRCSSPSEDASRKDIVLRAPDAKTSHKRREEPDPSILALDVASVFDAVQRCIGASA